MSINIQNSIELFFPLFQLGDNRSLLECDFYDTHYGYFDQIDDDYLSAIQLSAEGLLLEYGFDWPEFYIQVGLEAVRSRSRPQAVYHFLTSDQNKTYMDCFIFRLESQWEKDNHVFNDAQKKFIIEFVRENYKENISWITII